MSDQLYAMLQVNLVDGNELQFVAIGTKTELLINQTFMDNLDAYEEHIGKHFEFKFEDRIVPFGRSFEINNSTVNMDFPWLFFEIPQKQLPIPSMAAYDVTKSTAHHKAHLDLITHAINDKKFAVTVWDNKTKRECIARNCTDLAMLVSILEKVTPNIYKNVIFEFINQNINASTPTMFMGNVSVDLFEEKLMNVHIPATHTGWIREWKESFYNRGLGKQ